MQAVFCVFLHSLEFVLAELVAYQLFVSTRQISVASSLVLNVVFGAIFLCPSLQ